MYIPIKIRQIVKNIKPTFDDVGKSSDVVLIYGKKYVLKVSNDYEMLKMEYEKGNWLYDKIPTNKPIAFVKGKSKSYYLKEYLDGKPLIDKRYLRNPSMLIDLIIESFGYLEKVKNCPFKSFENEGNDFVHGDLCLPNILIKNDKVRGFVDIGNSGLGDKWYDYCWVYWSLARNLHTIKYNQDLLNKLGISFNKEKYDLYIPKELQDMLTGFLDK